jgi:hypothetical protein
MAMYNYTEALNYFLFEPVTENVIITIGMNRKSKSYDKQYYRFYELMHKVVFNKNSNNILQLYEYSNKLIGKSANFWRKYLFNTRNRQKIKQNVLSALNDVPILHATTEKDFKRLFFELMHLFKAKANLSDCADLNRRYFKTTDTIIFADGKAELDTLPRCWLYSSTDDLLNIAFTSSNNLSNNSDLAAIAPFLAINEQKLSENLKKLYNIAITNSEDINSFTKNERYKRFNKLIDERFNKSTLIDLLKKIQQRNNENDNAIRQAVTNNADIPTIFEYLLGITWYLISDRKGDILSFMNLSLEADLLPRTHAMGGQADIEYIYNQSPNYPAHALLIEATLTDGTNQRRAEMEPVSRHLGEYIIKNNNIAYCVFVSNYLDINVINDFRGRRITGYIDPKTKETISGMKIITLATSEIQKILKNDISYEKLYKLFETAYRSEEPATTWYEKEIANKL